MKKKLFFQLVLKRSTTERYVHFGKRIEDAWSQWRRDAINRVRGDMASAHGAISMIRKFRNSLIAPWVEARLSSVLESLDDTSFHPRCDKSDSKLPKHLGRTVGGKIKNWLWKHQQVTRQYTSHYGNIHKLFTYCPRPQCDMKESNVSKHHNRTVGGSSH